MTGRIYKRRAPTHKPTRAMEQETKAPKREANKLAAELDSMLDDIDAVLEENAEEFVNAYVQKGGQ